MPKNISGKDSRMTRWELGGGVLCCAAAAL